MERDEAVVGDERGVLVVGGVRVTVPEGSAPVGSRMVATAHRLEPGDPRQPVRHTAAAGPVRVTLDAELEGPVTVAFPVDEGPATVISAADKGRLWSPEITQVRDGMAVAEVEHLSWFDVVRDGWQDASDAVWDGSSWLSYTIADLALGNRADPPACQGPLPGWLRDINVIEDRNAPLLACGHADSDEVDEPLRLRLAANRGYSMVVDLPEDSEIPRPGTLEVGQAVAVALHGASDGQVVIPATATVEVTVPRPVGRVDTIDITAKTNRWSVAADAMWALFSELDLPASQAAGVYDCVVTSLSGAVQTDDVDAVLGTITASLRDCLEPMAETAGELDPGTERFLNKLLVADLTHRAGDALTDWATDTRLVQLFIETDTWTHTAPQDPEELLNEFMKAWWAQDEEVLAQLSTRQARDSFERNPDGWVDYRVDWDPQRCLGGSSGSGGCTIVLFTDTGAGFTWSLRYYETSAQGDWVVYDAAPVGGGL